MNESILLKEKSLMAIREVIRSKNIMWNRWIHILFLLFTCFWGSFLRNKSACENTIFKCSLHSFCWGFLQDACIVDHEVDTSTRTMIRIGDVSIKRQLNGRRVPRGWISTSGLLEGNRGVRSEAPSQQVLQHLRWMMQKDLLGADMFLLGAPSPVKRWL